VSSTHRLVLDTNIVVRAFINLDSDSGRILRACERRHIVPLLSKPLLLEYQKTLSHPFLLDRFPQLRRRAITASLERLLYVSDYQRRITARFSFHRDPKDSKLIELAISGRASHLITTDNDLLELSSGRDDAAKRFRRRLPKIEVLPPEQFTELHGDLLKYD
jgi:uncharacterized protein